MRSQICLGCGVLSRSYSVHLEYNIFKVNTIKTSYYDVFYVNVRLI